MNNMTKRTILGLIVLAAIVGIIFWIQDRNRNNDNGSETVLSVSAYNQTKNNDATQVKANPKDVVVYTLTAENQTDKVVSGYIVEVNIADITKYATLVDAQGANYNSSNNSLVWTPLDIPEKGAIEKKFTVKVKDEIPAGSDLSMTTKFNNEVKVAVAKPEVAGTNTGANPGTTPGTTPGYTAPKTGIPWTISLFLAVLITFGIFLFRIAQKLGKPL